MCIDLVARDLVGLSAKPATTRIPEQGMLVDAELEFADGSRAEITVGNLMDRKQRLLRVSAGERRLVYDDLASDKLVVEDGQGGSKPVEHSPVLPLNRALMAFRDSIRHREREHESLALGVRIVELLERMTVILSDYPYPRGRMASL